MTIMATSRESLRVDGEYVYRVPPLEVPAVDEDDPAQILSHSAVQLFVTRTAALNSDFLPRAENTAEIATICRQLDGIPLAIEFAAARASVLGVQQVNVGLRDRAESLRVKDGIALPRHRSLRGFISSQCLDRRTPVKPTAGCGANRSCPTVPDCCGERLTPIDSNQSVARIMKV